jgi:hypothetical protein
MCKCVPHIRIPACMQSFGSLSSKEGILKLLVYETLTSYSSKEGILYYSNVLIPL